jgi:predicted GIY-YIG superfamily endonuclease
VELAEGDGRVKSPYYVVYLLKLKTKDTYYVGMTGELGRRLVQHWAGNGATATTLHGVKAMVAVKPAQTLEHAKAIEGNWYALLKRKGRHIYGAGHTATVRRKASRSLPQSQKRREWRTNAFVPALHTIRTRRAR